MTAAGGCGARRLDPSDWSLDQAAAFIFLLVSGTDGATFQRRLDQLCDTADMASSLLSIAACLCTRSAALRASRGGRNTHQHESRVRSVAHRNRIPRAASGARVESNGAQTLFIGSTLDPIVGLDRRANPELARCCAITRMNAGPRVARSSRNCGVAWARMRAAKCCVTWGASRKRTGPERTAAALALAVRSGSGKQPVIVAYS